MKKVLLAITAILITAGAYAQSDSTNKKMTPPDFNNNNDGMNQNYIMQNDRDSTMNNKNMNNIHADGYMMQNGKMMTVKDGKMTMMEKDITLANGTMVMSNGSYMKKGGTKMMFKEGEHMDMMGKMVPMKATNPKNY